MLMPFGKYKGQDLNAVPDAYLLWLTANIPLREPLLRVVGEEITARELELPPLPPPRAQSPRLPKRPYDEEKAGSSLACPLYPRPPRPGSLAPHVGDHGPSDSALAAASGWRLRRPAADEHAARCASRDLCSGARPLAPCALGGCPSGGAGAVLTFQG